MAKKFKIECYDFEDAVGNDPNFKPGPGNDRHNCTIELQKLMSAFPGVNAKIIGNHGPDHLGIYVEVTAKDEGLIKKAFYAIACACNDDAIAEAKSWSKEKLDAEVESMGFSDVVKDC